MKKSILALSILAYVFVSTSCNQSSNSEPQAPKMDSVVAKAPEAPAPSSNPEDIKLNDLRTPCDYVDAMQKLIVAIDKVKGDDDHSELEKDQLKKIIKLFRKLENVGEAAEKQVTEAGLKECPNYDDVRGKIGRIEEEWGNEVQDYPDEETEDSEL